MINKNLVLSLLIVTQTAWASAQSASWKNWNWPPGTKKVLRIAFIDTGVDTNHTLLKGFDWSESFDFVENKRTSLDENGHGTHVAGIVAQQLLKWNMQDQVKMISLRYYTESWKAKNNMENSLKALEYAIKQNVDVINYSGGGHEPHPKEFELLQWADKKGILVIAAAGNDGWNTDQKKYYPANYNLSNIISIGAIDWDHKIASFSNWGAKSVDYFAMGNEIFSSLPKNKWGRMSGTSQATAMITAMVAWIVWNSKEPMAPYEVKSELTKRGQYSKNLAGRTKTALYLQSDDWMTTAQQSVRMPATERITLSK